MIGQAGGEEHVSMDQSEVQSQRAKLWGLLGDLPARERPIGGRVIHREERDGYELERLMLDLNGQEPVPALFVKPRGATGRLPTVLYNHFHGGRFDLGNDELISHREVPGMGTYAQELTARGYAALAIDHWCFGERQGLEEQDRFKLMLWNGQVLWGMMVYDSVRALDYLLTRGDVDGARLATVGMSMGSTMAWWLAALDERVKVCVDICCLTDFQALIDLQHLSGHAIYYYVPRLLKHFTTAQINALIAPRPHLSLAGNFDKLTPAAGLDRIDAELKGVYAQAGASEAWRLSRYDVQHMETAAMRMETLAWLERWL
ncbi:MAG: acetylxylan esterase [Phycisphaeraceae bacterium]|nr:acetylxylan esterase [Phycisphaeraceae bacterium]